MDLPELAVDGAAIVIIGKFYPGDVNPNSFAAKGMLGTDVALSAVSPLTTPNVSSFDAAWLHCEATDNRILFSTAEPAEFASLRDLALAFLNVFTGVEVSAVGLNRNAHFAIASEAEWHAIGDRLLPKADWNHVLKLPGTRSAVIQGVRPDDFMGHVQVTIEPSFRLVGSYGIYIEHNDHYFLRRAESQPSSREHFPKPGNMENLYADVSAEHVPIAKDIIASKWDDSMSRAEGVIEAVWHMRDEGS